MRKAIAFATLLAVSSGCAAQDEFQNALALAREIISAELAGGQICKPVAIPAFQRTAMIQALSRIDLPGLSDPTGLGPLDLAVISDDIPTVKRISALGYFLDAPESTLLHGAALHNSMQVLPFLLASGTSPDSVNSYGATSLMSAAASDRLEAASSLLAAGASPNARNNNGGTALHYAIGCRNQEMTNLLLAAGAEIDPVAQALADKHKVVLTQHER